MKTTLGHILVAAVLAAVLSGAAMAQETAPAAPAPVRPPAAAVLTFESNLADPPDSGRLLADILSARLDVLGELTMVERADLAKVLDEQKLVLSGLVSPDDAPRVGKLLGAKLLVTGRINATGTKVYVICKIVSSETGQVKGFFLSLPQNVSLDEVMEKVHEQFAGSLGDWVGGLVPARERGADDVAILQRRLQGRQAQTVAVVVPEVHIGPPAVDPAVETEFKKLLTEAGVKVTPLSAELAARLAKGVKDRARLGELLPGTRYLVYGEAFSENGGQVHGLVVGVARAEIQILDLQTNEILLADRATARAPDLSEHLAGKTALQKAGRELARKMLPALFARFPEARAEANAEAKAEAAEREAQ